MRKAIFIVGFNNWGKTTLITELFNGQQKFYYAYDYQIPGVSAPNRFMVQSQSNDDVGLNFINQVSRRIDDTAPRTPDLFAALCPSMEPNNNFTTIITDPTFDVFDEFHFFLIRYKWEHHAMLLTDEIIATCGRLRPRMHFYIIDEGSIPVDDRLTEKLNQIKQHLNIIYP